MKRHALFAGLVLLLAGCRPPETKLKAIIGAMLIDGTGGPPIPDAVIVTEGSRIRGAGPRPLVPVPAGSEKVNGAGKFVTPGLIDLAGTPAVGAYVGQGVTCVRGALANAPLLGTIGEAGEIDAGVIRRLLELRLVFAPQLAKLEASPGALALAQRNTKRLAAGGVPIAVASTSAPGEEVHREIELLAGAGLSPMEVILAATRNGAYALGKTEEVGTIEPGKRADLLLLSANPLEDARNLRRIERVMVNGEWAEVSTPR